jgi:hypothetical protein
MQQPATLACADKENTVPKMRVKADLPRKTCAACGRPFTWRKKWAKDWDEVKTCSERCKGDLRRKRGAVATDESSR